MEQNALFRKAALDKLASPERLDVLMQVTSPKGWAALLTMAVIIAGVIGWSIVGSMPEEIDGQGMILRGGGTRDVLSSGDGVLAKLTLQVDQMVKVDDLVGEVAGVDVAGRVDVARQKYEDASREANAGRAEGQANIQGVRATQQGNQADIDRTDGDLARAREQLTRLQDLFKQQNTTASRVQAAERDVNALQSRISALRAQIAQGDAQIRGIQERMRALDQNAAALKAEYESAVKGVANTSDVKATVAGRVVELKKKVGDRVSRGEVLAVIEPPSGAIEPVVFVPANQGKRIQPGMEVQISPSNVKREEFGFIRGTVGAVSEYPIDVGGMMSVLNNDALVKEIQADGSAKIQVRIKLTPSSTTPSGFQWSSSSGPPFRIGGGTQVAAAVIVERRAPISKVLPLIKGAIGAS